tara:strand:- start:2799 stop:3074 length:276 start_codon:yes stop_codon:yes gene_type:complete
MILIGAFRKTEFISCRKECLVQFSELLMGIPPHCYGSCITVMIVVSEVKVTFKSTEGLQYVLPSPFCVTSIGPVVVIFGDTTQKDARVNRT